jgi:hypothetical protein
MLKKLYTVGFALILILVFSSCKQETGIKGIDLEVNFSEDELSDNLVTDMTFIWKTSSEFEGMR